MNKNKFVYVLQKPDYQENNVLIRNLLNQLEFTRNKTIAFIESLPPYLFDTKIVKGLNSIGTILRHIAAMEFSNQLITFQGRQLNDEEAATWYGSLAGQLRLDLIKGYPPSYYINLLKDIRKDTERILFAKDDDWLFCNTLFQYDMPVNNYFSWFHVMEDELSHMGQIKMLCYYHKNP